MSAQSNGQAAAGPLADPVLETRRIINAATAQVLAVRLAELLLTKLRIVELNERDQRDIYNLLYHHQVSDGDGSGIEADYSPIFARRTGACGGLPLAPSSGARPTSPATPWRQA